MQIPHKKYGVAQGEINCNSWNFSTTAKVNFTISHTKNYLHILFTVEEENAAAYCTTLNSAVWEDSCVEFFCSFDGKHYYNIECNCIGTLHCGYGKDRGRGEECREILSEKLLQMIHVQPSLGNKPFLCNKLCRWTLSLSIPVTFFYHDKLFQFSGRCATCNFYKCGNLLIDPHYLSWAPIITEKPDFHRPEFFAPIYFLNDF